MTFKGDGIYYISNAHVSVRMGLAGGSDFRPVIGWPAGDIIDHMWLIKAVPGEPDTYTLCNLNSGTYMDMKDNSSQNGTWIIAFPKTNPGENQKWIIKQETSGAGYWKIYNKSTKTFADLLNGNATGGTHVVGWQGSWNDGSNQSHQHWIFEPLSLRGQEVHTILQASPYLGVDFKSYAADGLYLILSQSLLRGIWNNTGLQGRPWREQIFDCDDFAFVYKAEVAKWVNDNIKANGFTALCGVMFGQNSKGGHAYNWMIKSDNLSQLVFFEPQNNTFMDNPGYTSFFGVF